MRTRAPRDNRITRLIDRTLERLHTPDTIPTEGHIPDGRYYVSRPVTLTGHTSAGKVRVVATSDYRGDGHGLVIPPGTTISAERMTLIGVGGIYLPWPDDRTEDAVMPTD